MVEEADAENEALAAPVHIGAKTKDADLKRAASERLDTMAKAYATKNNVPYNKAYDAVLATDEGRQLYKCYRDEQQASV